MQKNAVSRIVARQSPRRSTVRRFCREHFISVCYTRLDQYDEIRKGPGLSVTDTESVRRFIHECTRSADEIEHSALDLDNLDRAKLLHIILTASELGRHLRRSPRKVATIAVKLSSEKLGGAWEEDTETVLVSRYGALVRCKHPAKAGETIHVIRADTGEKTLARVAWQRPSGFGKKMSESELNLSAAKISGAWTGE